MKHGKLTYDELASALAAAEAERDRLRAHRNEAITRANRADERYEAETGAVAAMEDDLEEARRERDQWRAKANLYRETLIRAQLSEPAPGAEDV